MATPQLSPGVITREVDLTVGRADNVLDNIGAIAGPFPIGPVNEPILVTNETDLINVFGKPLSTDRQYEYWMSASSFLSYGGVLKVVRATDDDLNNANAGVGMAFTTTLQVLNYDDYQNNHTNDATFTYAAKNPGSWGNQLKVCQIDDFADQIIGIGTTNVAATGAQIGFGITAPLANVTIPGQGTTASFTGFLKGIITGITTDASNGTSELEVKVVSRVNTAGSETKISYQQGTEFAAFDTSDDIRFLTNAGVVTTGVNPIDSHTPTSVLDWYDQQTLGLTNATIFWKELAPRPVTSTYVAERNGRNDGIHVAVVDDNGGVTGIRGNLIEKHLNLSKAEDAVSAVNAPDKIYYKEYIADRSANIYAGYSPASAEDTYHQTVPRALGFSTDFTAVTTGGGIWGQNSQDTNFNGIGNITYTLGGGEDYAAGVPDFGEYKNGGMTATLGNIVTAYDKFSNKDEEAVDFFIMGPGCSTKSESQAKANKLIQLAELRKDSMACIGPHRADIIGLSDSTTQTTNLINFFSPLSSSSFATFDSGYAYKYDRFNNEFRYVPTNGDIAGLMVRTNIISYPWFSPAGQQRGILNNVVKLAYNPDKAERDQLYPLRVNSVITKPGVGTLLFGDKTALSNASAFDRINVRRLFLTVEQALQSAAESQLFELNDELTRANFRNIVEPFLRDVEAKRGISGFLVVCDTSNNTPDVIDNNEFRADIFLKPARSINFITLTFVATRTGVSFEEVAGRV